MPIPLMFWVGQERNRPLGHVLQGWGSQVLTSLSLSLVGEIVDLEGLFGSFPPSWERKNKGKVKLVLTASMHLFLDFLLHRGAGTS